MMKPVPVTILSISALERAGSNGAGAGTGLPPRPRMSRTQAAWRASTECTESAAASVFLFAIMGAAPAYADTPVSSSAMAVARNVDCAPVVPLKSNMGFLTALAPERTLEEGDVRGLVVCHDLGELGRLAGELALCDGLGVEG